MPFNLFHSRFHFYVVYLDGGNGEETFGDVFHPPATKLTVTLLAIRNSP